MLSDSTPHSHTRTYVSTRTFNKSFDPFAADAAYVHLVTHRFLQNSRRFARHISCTYAEPLLVNSTRIINDEDSR